MWRPALSSHFLGRNSIFIRCARRNSTSATQEVDKNHKFSLVYKLPHIRAIALINRTKLIQSAVSVAVATGSFALLQTDMITNPVFIQIVSLALAINVPWYLLGILSNNVVGHVYLSEDGGAVKISYLNNWGRREDVVIEVNDIIPLSEIAGNTSEVYFKIERYSQPCKLKFSLKHGMIEKPELFTKIFGKLNKEM